ncbi:DENN domain-containing protein 2D isoform X3 [Homo sapiens]|uniref:DENN domain-containing protein 2D isoform X3 n=1 Tax=Homo sapiens TaxID=9606 RepID=UPI0023DFE6D4|nr:DENN domain-containing protein 2D isoform X3 [Homo sapiens]
MWMGAERLDTAGASWSVQLRTAPSFLQSAQLHGWACSSLSCKTPGLLAALVVEKAQPRTCCHASAPSAAPQARGPDAPSPPAGQALPAGPGPRLPKVYCIISCIGCFGLFSKILDEVEKRHQISMAVIYPFMQGLREAAFPAPGKTVTLKSFIPDSGTEFISLTRPLDSHLEHVDFSSLLHCLSFEQILQIFASAVLERKIIFLAEGLSTLSQCIHAAAALLYPFSWAHTYIPVVPESLLATVCCPTPFMVGVQMRFQQEVMDSPMEEVLLVNLCEGTFLMSVGDEKDILPPKLQDDILDSLGQGINELKTAEQINEHVSGPFVQFFVKIVGHYASYIKREANGQGHFQERSFCKALTSKTNRRFVKKFVKTQLFSLFIQEAEKSKNPPAGYFQQKILEYEEQKKQKKPREKTVK